MEKSQFRAPEYASELLSKVNSRCEKLVKTGVWDFNMSRLRGWVNNFRNSEEQYLCAHLLDSLMYRSDRMADSLCRHAVHSVLPNSMSTYPESLEIWRRALEGSKEITTLFVAVEGIKNGKKQAAKSGQRVLRQYHSSGAVNRNHFVDASYLLEKISGYPVERIVYIDDFCGTGRQFKDFYTHYELRKIPSDIEQYYVPFACHTEAVNSTFQKDITGVIARPVEMLSSNSAFLSKKMAPSGVTTITRWKVQNSFICTCWSHEG